MRRFVFKLDKARQMGLFGGGGGAASAPAPAPAKPKKRHKVKRHLAKNPGGKGYHIVEEHDRGSGEGADKPPARKPVQKRPSTWDLVPPESMKPRKRDKSGRTKHHDTGERIAGARKFTSVSLSDLGAIEAMGEKKAAGLVKKAKVLGPFDEDYHRSMGSTPGGLYMKRELWKLVGASPTSNDPVMRQLYVAGCTWMKKRLDACETAADVVDFMETWRHMTHGEILTPRMDADDALRALKLTRDDVSQDASARYTGGGIYKVADFYVTKNQLREAGYVDVKYVSRTEVQLIYRADPPTDETMRKAGLTLSAGAFAAATARSRSKPALEGLYLASMGKAFGKAMTKGGRSVPKIWTDHKWAATRLDEQAAKDPEGAWEKAAPKGEATKSAKRRSKPWARHLTMGDRVGGPAVDGEITADRLAEDFGFRGVQFGNWVDDEGAEFHLHRTVEAMTDLADILGLDPKMLAHSGRLAIAFGARGKGRASAHYEPGQMVINLTNTRGGGSLAHEWGHFMDHVLSGSDEPGATDWVATKPGQVRSRFLSHHEGLKNVPGEVAEAVRDVMLAIKTAPGSAKPPVSDDEHRANYLRIASMGRAVRSMRSTHPEYESKRTAYNAAVEQYRADAKAIAAAKKGVSKYRRDAENMGDYWSHPHEMFARAFESYVEDKLHAKKRRNPYLVDGTRRQYNLTRVRGGAELKGLEVYPQGEERKAINAAMDRFVSALRKHGTLKKAMERAAGVENGQEGGTRIKALHAHAMLADREMQSHVREMQGMHRELLAKAQAATSPHERAEYEALAHKLHETVGGIRYQPVTGGDASGVA